MEKISLKEALLIYSERFEDGHPLKDIALTTLHELGRTNPFGGSKLHEPFRVEILDTKRHRHYSSLSDAIYGLGKQGLEAKKELCKVLKKYDLKLI